MLAAAAQCLHAVTASRRRSARRSRSMPLVAPVRARRTWRARGVRPPAWELRGTGHHLDPLARLRAVRSRRRPAGARGRRAGGRRGAGPLRLPDARPVRPAVLRSAPLSPRSWPDADLRWTAWNEPDHPMFTLLDGLGGIGARGVLAILGTGGGDRGSRPRAGGRVLRPRRRDLLRLRRAFVDGAGRSRPLGRCTHTATSPRPPRRRRSRALPARRARARLADEVTARLSGRGGLGGNPAAQLAKGHVAARRDGPPPHPRAILYLSRRHQTLRASPPATTGPPRSPTVRAAPARSSVGSGSRDQCPGDPATYGG